MPELTSESYKLIDYISNSNIDTKIFVGDRIFNKMYNYVLDLYKTIFIDKAIIDKKVESIFKKKVFIIIFEVIK